MDEITEEITFTGLNGESSNGAPDKDMSVSAFTDGAQPAGQTLDYRLAMVKTRDAFLELFAGARHIDAITYSDTPSLLVTMLTEYDIGSLDVFVGDTQKYSEDVSSVKTAKELLELRQQGDLTVRLRKRKVIHSKIYRVVMPDETVKLVHGSANLSNNSWRNHTNQIAVFTTSVGSDLDEQWVSFIDEYRDTYSDTTLLEGLVEAVEQADDEEEREKQIEYWVETDDDLNITDTAAMNQDATEDIAEIADKVTAVVSDPDEADETIAFADEGDVDHTITPTGDEFEFPAERSSDDASPATDGTAAPEQTPSMTLTESNTETEITGTIDRPRVKMGGETIRMGTNKVDKDNADEFGSSLSHRGATVEDHSIVAPMSAYNNQVKESIKIPTMSVLPETEQVALGEDTDMILVATDQPTPKELDHCLETLEMYIETVEDHGHTQTPEAIMAQMYEAFLYGFWAPFANQYAEALSSPSRTLNNVLQHLYIVGNSDAGKDKLVEYILRLLSDNTVVSGVDADEVGIKEVRGVREWDTCFPYAVIDAEKNKIESWSPIRNYWGDWTPTTVDQPCLMFTTNDALPKSEFRNRMKILSMDVSFPSNAKEPGFKAAQDDLTAVLERPNPIFSYVARRMVTEKPWTDGTGTVEDVRRIFCDFYARSNRDQPSYFPHDEPAEKKHDTGRLNWQKDIQGGRVTFTQEPGAITAEFEREGYEIYDFEKRLPKRMMSDKSGTSVYIGAPDEFADWTGFSQSELLSGEAAAHTHDSDLTGRDTRQDETDTDDESGGWFSSLF